MKDDESLDSFRSSLDANYDWPCLFPFKFIVPKDQSQTVLDLFADDPVKSNESSSGRFIGYTMEMNMHSSRRSDRYLPTCCSGARCYFALMWHGRLSDLHIYLIFIKQLSIL